MVLNLAQVEDSLVFRTGKDVMESNGVVLFGMSPGNPYFKSGVIEDYVDYLGKEKRRIIVVVPQQPAEHTYRALGSKDAVKRAKKNSSQLKSHCRRAIEKVNGKNLTVNVHILFSLCKNVLFLKSQRCIGLLFSFRLLVSFVIGVACFLLTYYVCA